MLLPRSILETPRPAPSRTLPAIVASVLVVAALPVFIAAGWSVGGWALGASLWFAGEAMAFAIGRLPMSLNNLVSSSFVGVAMTFRVIAVMVVLLIVANSNRDLALSAALLFIVAYSLELGLSLLLYFGSEPRGGGPQGEVQQ
jgi:hypothetical protein